MCTAYVHSICHSSIFIARTKNAHVLSQFIVSHKSHPRDFFSPTIPGVEYFIEILMPSDLWVISPTARSTFNFAMLLSDRRKLGSDFRSRACYIQDAVQLSTQSVLQHLKSLFDDDEANVISLRCVQSLSFTFANVTSTQGSCTVKRPQFLQSHYHTICRNIEPYRENWTDGLSSKK